MDKLSCVVANVSKALHAYVLVLQQAVSSQMAKHDNRMGSITAICLPGKASQKSTMGAKW